MNNNGSPPVAAILLPDAPPAKTPRLYLWGFFSLLGVICLFCCGVGGWSILTISSSLNSRSVDLLAAHWPTPEENQRALAAAFTEEKQSSDHPDYASISRFLARLARVSNSGDQKAFREMIDFPRHLRRIAAYPGAQVSSFQQYSLGATLKSDTTFNEGIPSFRLAHIESLSKDEVVVSAYAEGDTYDNEPFRFWLARRGATWSIVDWEAVLTGWSTARLQAEYSSLANSESVFAFDMALASIDKAVENATEGDKEEGAITLARTENFVPPARLASYWRYRRSQALAHCNRWEEMREECKAGLVHEELPIFFYFPVAFRFQLKQSAEETLAAAEKYECCAGFDASTVRQRANALSELGRTGEAIAQYRRLISFNPESVDDLTALAELLPAQEHGPLFEIASQKPNSAKSAITLANLYVDRGYAYEALVDGLVKIARAAEPKSAEVLELQGDVWSSRGDYQQAADFYLQAAEADPEDSYSSRAQWLETMHRLGKLPEALAAAPDFKEAFDHLFDGIEDQESILDIKVLKHTLPLMRERFPNDPLTAYYAAFVAKEGGDFAAAERELLASPPFGEDDFRKSLRRDLLIHVLIQQNRPRDAYKQFRGDEEAFSSIASELADLLDHNSEKLADLTWLINEHRGESPGDEWLPYYEAVQSRHSGQWEQARERLAALSADAPEPVTGVRYVAGNTLCKWRMADLGPLVAYRDTATPKVDFSTIANELRWTGKWQLLDALCDEHEGRFADDPNLLEQRVLLAEVWKKDQELVDRISAALPSLQQSDWMRSELRRKQAFALIRLGRTDEAIQLGRDDSQTDDAELLKAVLFKLGKWEELTQLLRSRKPATGRKKSASLPNSDWSDRLAYFSAADAAELRREFPSGLPMRRSQKQVVLLLNKPQPLPRDLIEKCVTADERLIPLSQIGAGEHWRIQSARGSFVLSSCDRCFTSEADLKFSNLAPAAQRSLSELRHYVRVSYLPDSGNVWDHDSAAALRLRQLAFALAPAAADGFVYDTIEAENRLYPLSGDLLAGFREKIDNDFAPPADAQKTYLNASDEDANDESDLSYSDSKRVRAEREVQKSLHESDGRILRVRTRIHLGGLQEDVWLRITSVYGENWYASSYLGEWESPSHLFPEIHPGDLFLINRYEVREWAVEPKPVP